MNLELKTELNAEIKTETYTEIENLHKNAQDIARQFHRAESALIDILQLIDDKRVYFKLGYTSLFDYSVKALKLSESTASNFITVARKSKTVPELKMAIFSGDLTVSKARKITPILTPSNQAHWIGLAKTLPKHKLEKEIAKQIPETATLEDTLGRLIEFYLSKRDPVAKAKKVVTSSDEHVYVPGTRYVNAHLKHQIRLRDGFQCAHIGEQGERCDNKRWIEIHHKMPLHRGGANSLNNLQTLCSAHHKMDHAASEYKSSSQHS